MQTDDHRPLDFKCHSCETLVHSTQSLNTYPLCHKCDRRSDLRRLEREFDVDLAVDKTKLCIRFPAQRSVPSLAYDNMISNLMLEAEQIAACLLERRTLRDAVINYIYKRDDKFLADNLVEGISELVMMVDTIQEYIQQLFFISTSLRFDRTFNNCGPNVDDLRDMAIKDKDVVLHHISRLLLVARRLDKHVELVMNVYDLKKVQYDMKMYPNIMDTLVSLPNGVINEQTDIKKKD